MNEHTPGPLKAGPREITAICKDGWVLYRGRPEFTEADARLYAAAPDLLAACEAAKAEVRIERGEQPKLYAQLDAAIAKARGRDA